MNLPGHVSILGLTIPVQEVSSLEDAFCESRLYEGVFGEEIVPEHVQTTNERMIFAHELGHVLGIVHEQDYSEETAWKYARLLLGKLFDEGRYQELLDERRKHNEAV